MYLAAQRVARRFAPAIQRSFLAAVQKLQDQIDMDDLQSALASRNLAQIQAAVASGGDLATIMSRNRQIEKDFLRTLRASGVASAEILSGSLDVTFDFNAMSPRAILWASEHAGEFVVGVSESVREAVRIFAIAGQAEGITVAQQARVLREVAGVMPQHAAAPANLMRELRLGKITGGRRLSAADYAAIRSRIAKGTLTDEFIEQMGKRYARSLKHYRARVIAHHESLSSSYAGLQESWQQASYLKHLPPDTRRFAVVTPDDRLRATHAAVPRMNPDGVGLTQPFQTPMGALMMTPWEIACRCGVTLGFPGRPGLL